MSSFPISQFCCAGDRSLRKFCVMNLSNSFLAHCRVELWRVNRLERFVGFLYKSFARLDYRNVEGREVYVCRYQ